MQRIVLFCVSMVIAGAWASTAFAEAELPRVSEGFSIAVAAEAPVVERPVMANFDDRGRLYVVDSSGSNLRFDDLLKNPPHRIVVLEDTNGDGKFDTRKVFADKLVMPQGVLPYRGAVYVASPPSVWKLEDTDGDGVADKRTEIVTEFGSNGNGADIHGPFLGPDGWLYLCDGRHGHKVKRDDGTIDQGLAGGIFRFRTDGTGFERVCGGGFDNPVEIDFTDAGEMIGTVNILHGNPREDCLMHWVEGGVYPRHDQEQCIKEFKLTGDLLPPIKKLGHIAVSGMMIYRSTHFGPEYRGNVFTAIFNTHKVLRSVLKRSGATFTSREEEFLVSTNPDSHFTDVLEDADGSLLVIDTGGWFRIGCPVSQVAKPDIFGTIYRVRKKDAKPASGQRSQASNPAASAPGDVTDTLNRPNENARIVAARTAGMIGDVTSVSQLNVLVVKDAPPVRLAAATALGRILRAKAARVDSAQRVASVAALFESLRAGVTDRFLEHALIYALIEIADRESTLPFLKDQNPQVRRAALIALDQMDGGNLTRELVSPLLDTDDPQLRNTAMAIIGNRPGWAAEMVALLRGWLQEKEPAADQRAVLRGVLLAQAGDAQIQKLIAESLASQQTAPAVRLLLWEVVYRSGIETIPDVWLNELARVLECGPVEERRQVIAILQERSLPQFDGLLLKLAAEGSQSLDLQTEALAAVAVRLKALDEPLFTLLKRGLKPDAAPLLRLAAARAVGDAPLSREQLLQVAELLHEAGPLAVPVLLRAFARSNDEAAGLVLVRVLNQSSVADNLSPDELGGILRKYPDSVQKAGSELLRRLGGATLEQQKARLHVLAKLLDPPGDAQRGRAIFFGRRAACTGCHAVGKDGGRVGPDLTKIGAIRTGADLLEALAFPSASFARDFRPYTIVTDGGKIFTGVLSRQTADAVYLRTAELAEIRIARKSIDEMKESNTSIMPKGLDTSLSADELRDLLAYLKELK